MTSFKIHIRAGVICFGGSTDFLVCIQKAQEAKASIKLLMPFSTVIAQLFYENGDRVPGADIKAALRSLTSSNVAEMVALRRAKSFTKAPARSEASTAAFCNDSGAFFAGRFGRIFCQAGVVAPPDSPDFGNLPVSSLMNI